MQSDELFKTITEEEFLSEARRAIESGAVLDLTGRCVTLTAAFKLKRAESIAINGGHINGDCHSIFSIGTDRATGPPALRLTKITLNHILQSEDKREVGAACFVMGRAKIEIEDSQISSVGGFGLW